MRDISAVWRLSFILPDKLYRSVPRGPMAPCLFGCLLTVHGAGLVSCEGRPLETVIEQVRMFVSRHKHGPLSISRRTSPRTTSSAAPAARSTSRRGYSWRCRDSAMPRKPWSDQELAELSAIRPFQRGAIASHSEKWGRLPNTVRSKLANLRINGSAVDVPRQEPASFRKQFSLIASRLPH